MSLKKKQSLIEELKNGKQRRWKITFHWPKSPLRKNPFPKEFICPISLSLMADPVIVSSGQTLDRNCALICKKLNFNPFSPTGSAPDFSLIIPNLSLKSAIANWCKTHLIETPKPIDLLSAENLVRKLISSTESTRPSRLSSRSVESVAVAASAPPTPLLSLTTRPACLSSSSSSEDAETLPNSVNFYDNIIDKLNSVRISEQTEVLSSLRKITRTQEETRARLCTPQLLSALRSKISSGYSTVEIDAVACLVNLSLEDRNKIMIVRSGIVPPLINVLKNGSPEAQDHATGLLFSLSLDDRNKTAIGVLGALPPLLLSLSSSSSERARHDASLALCHLSLVQTNRSKLVRLGSVNVLLGMVKAGRLTGRVVLVLCNLALGQDGRDAMLEGGAVECFVGILSRVGSVTESTRCVGETGRVESVTESTRCAGEVSRKGLVSELTRSGGKVSRAGLVNESTPFVRKASRAGSITESTQCSGDMNQKGSVTESTRCGGEVIRKGLVNESTRCGGKVCRVGSVTDSTQCSGEVSQAGSATESTRCFGEGNRAESVTESTRESCLSALYRLSYGGVRFRVLARDARAEEVLAEAEKTASKRGKEKIERILEVLRGKEEEEEVDWEELLKTD